MLFSDKSESSMQQEDKLECIQYAKFIPGGGMDLLSIQISRPTCTSILSNFILIRQSQK
jgi:hypothetical protein